jgi:hypothetical protein
MNAPACDRCGSTDVPTPDGESVLFCSVCSGPLDWSEDQCRKALTLLREDFPATPEITATLVLNASRGCFMVRLALQGEACFYMPVNVSEEDYRMKKVDIDLDDEKVLEFVEEP